MGTQQKILRYFITDTCDKCEKIEVDKSLFLKRFKNEMIDYCSLANASSMGANLCNAILRMHETNTFKFNLNGYLYEIETEEWYEK